MNDIRYKNLYDALTSQIDYGNFIETFSEDNISFKNTNFDLLQTIYGAFSLTQVMDDYFIKQNDAIKCTLMPEFVKMLVEKVATYNGRGYTIGDLMYHDEYTVLEKLRNKLAHGDFVIKNGEIVFEENKVEGRIKVEEFLSLVYALETEAQQYTLSDSCTKIFNKCMNEKKLRKITNEKDMDYICNNLYRIEIIDSPIFPRTRTVNYIQIRNNFYNAVKMKIVTSPIKEVEQYIKKEEPILKQYGINIKYSIKSIKELEYYENIKKKYMDMNDEYQKISVTKQINRISNLSFILGNGQYQKIDIRKGLELNRYIMKKLKEHPEYSLKQIITENDNIDKLFVYHMNSVVISSYLVGFNAAYEYGLEKGLTQKGNYNIVSIFECKSLDFSKLEIDALDDPNMLIEHTFNKYLTDVPEYEIKKLNSANRLIETTKKKLEQYINNCKNIKEEKIKEFEQEINEAEMLKIELQNNIKELKKFVSEFDLEKYTRNINIIIHIRNAIAHGNVFVDSYATDIQDTDIIFRDYLDGQIVYEKKIKIRDFVLLFHSTNIQNVYNFITNNIEDKTLVDEDYCEKLYERCLLRELREMKNETINSHQLVKK